MNKNQIEAAAVHMQLFLAGVVSVYNPTPREFDLIVQKAVADFGVLLAKELGGK